MNLKKAYVETSYWSYKLRRLLTFGILILGVPFGIGFLLLGKDVSFDVYCTYHSYPLVGDMKTECTVEPRDGIIRNFQDKVTLSCPDIPRGLSCVFAKSEVGPPYGEIPLQIVATPEAKKGTYRIIVHATNGDLKRDSTVDIEIR